MAQGALKKGGGGSVHITTPVGKRHPLLAPVKPPMSCFFTVSLPTWALEPTRKSLLLFFIYFG